MGKKSVRNRTAIEAEIRTEAEGLLSSGTTATEFANRFFSPEGRLRELWDTDEERTALVRSETYRWLRGKLTSLEAQERAAFDQEAEALSGRLTIMVPKSLHASLKREATSEGVSLSELIRLKLILPFRTSVLQ